MVEMISNQSCCGVSISVPKQKSNVGDNTISLSLPTIHCAGCMNKIENGLETLPQVSSARVNLSLKRVIVQGAKELKPEDLILALNNLGYEALELNSSMVASVEGEDIAKDYLTRLGVSGFVMMNVMLMSVAVWAGADGVTRDMFHIISGIIATPAIIFSGMPFYRGAFSALRQFSLNMDVPISLAIILTLATSLWETYLGGHHAYFDAAISLVFFLLIGRYLDVKTRSVAKSAAQELSALEATRAIKLMGMGLNMKLRLRALRLVISV